MDSSGNKRYVDLIRTYFPVRDFPPGEAREGAVVGILAMDQDVTEDLAQARSDSLRFAVLASTGTGVALFAMLFLVVYRADRIIKRGYEGILRHQAERLRAEDALRQSNDSLEAALRELRETQQHVIQQERLRALGQMASGIAHDFNNALVPIVGFAELLLDKPGTPKLDREHSRSQDYVRMIATAAQDAAIVSRLREFYRAPDPDAEFSRLLLNDVVEQSVSITEPQWKNVAQARNIPISVETDLQEVPAVMGSDHELRELMSNLILNAVDAMPQGGTITFRTRPDRDDVVLEVVDTGVGMTAEVKERCLEPFFTTKGQLGTGMGLSMVHGTIQRHGGKLDIDSEPMMGTTFIIRLPVATATEATIEIEEERVRLKGLNVLIADDEPSVHDVIVGYLKSDGHTAVSAANGREALDEFLKGKFDVVVADRAMPEMNGDELAASVKKVSHCPVILLTGFAEVMRSTGDSPACVDLILGKPLTLNALRGALHSVVTGEPAE